jgi:acyl-CoA synthetase (NDP forming)/GNAT superfamily N-acetyltransferase
VITTEQDPGTGWDALAVDGSVVHIRLLRPEDEEELKALNHRVSDRSIYLRFFALDRHGADAQAHHLAAPAVGDHQVALLAEVAGRIVGVGSFELIRVGEAEMAFLVDDAAQGHGIGTLLLEQLAAIAHEQGIRRLLADTLADNGPMLSVFTRSGFEQVHTLDHGVVELSLDTDYAPTGIDRMAERERDAGDRSLRRLLTPSSVAVIGAGRRVGGIGHEVLANLVEGGFTGDLVAVNPQARQIEDITSYPSIGAVPGPVDLVVIAVPAAQVPTVLEECGQAGVGGAVILSAGFGESGPGGQEIQRGLVVTARRYGLRLIGPNCLGIANTNPAVRLEANFATVRPLAGTLALAAQSGAVGVAVLDHASRVGLGISEFVSLGNKIDVSGNDLLLHWWQEPRTDVIGLYLESFGNPRKFARLARLVGRTKPVLVVKSGRSSSGRRAGASHTAAAATPDTAVDALFAQAGVLRMDTLEELVETARVLAGRPLPHGRRLGVVGNAGGAGVLAADAAETFGVEVPELSELTRKAMAEAMGSATAANPTDLGAAASAEVLERAIKVSLDSGEIDALLVVFAATRAGNVDETYAAIARAAAGATIPVVVTCLGAPGAALQVELADGGRLPVFPFPEGAVRALSQAMRYAEWRARPQGVVPELSGVDLDAARTVVADLLAGSPEGGWLDPPAAEQLIRAAGIPIVPTAAAADRACAIAGGERVGYPVALKTAAAGVVHKTDVGGVELGIADGAALGTAYDAVVGATGDPHVLIQTMVPTGTELVAGLVRDPLFGPVVMAGSGGLLTDLLADRRWCGLPLTDLDATEMVRSLRCAPLLAGYRGAKPADLPAVLEVLHRIAWLAEHVPEVSELDINPLVATPAGAFAVDLKVRIAPAAIEPAPYSRRLR